MANPDTILDYLAAVTGQIRWKRARPILSQELERHLEDQKNDFLSAGQPEKEAERLAVAEMGDPVAVGIELDRIHRPNAQWGPLLLTAALALTGGLLRVFLGTLSAFPHIDAADPFKTALALLLGTACMLGIYFWDYSRLIKHTRLIYLGTLVLSAFLWFFVNRYYLRYLVLLYPVVYALWLFQCRGLGWLGFALAILGGVPLAFLILLTNDLSALFLFLTVGFVLLLCAIQADWFGVPRRRAVFAAILTAGGLAAVILPSSHHAMWSRLYIALHPETDYYGYGYFVNSIQNALRQSTWLHTAPEPSHLDALWGPDFLLSEVVYQVGWLPFLLITAALCALCMWLAIRCLRQRNQAGRMIALAVVLALGTQTISALALNLGFLVVKAHLPLLVGNLHTVLDMALIGLALSVFRGTSIAHDQVQSLHLPHLRISWELSK